MQNLNPTTCVRVLGFKICQPMPQERAYEWDLYFPTIAAKSDIQLMNGFVSSKQIRDLRQNRKHSHVEY